MDIHLISPENQKEWAWPATANFTLGSAGAGFYIVSVFAMLFENGISAMTEPLFMGLLSPAMMGFGFILLAMEAGRPSRGRYLLRNIHRSWISRETLAFVLFIPAVILDQLFPGPVFKTWAILSALFFMVSQGFIVYSSRAMTTWNKSIIPIFFLSSGFTSGAGVALALSATGRVLPETGLGLASLICVILNSAIWFSYMRCSKTADYRSATRTLRRPVAIFITVVFGHIFPALMLLLFLLWPSIVMETSFQGPFAVVVGLAIIIGVMAQKAGIIQSAGYTRKICLKS